MTDVDQGVPVLWCEASADTEVAGVVDGRLGSERAALFEVPLDLRGAVMDLDRSLDACVDDPGVEPAGGLAGDTATEHDGDLVAAAERELVRKRLLKPRPAGGGAVEGAGVGDLKLPER